MEFLLNIIAMAATSSMFLRIAKYLDFRLGPQKISSLKNKGRLEKLWRGLAAQSPKRFALRVLKLVEALFCSAFGEKPVSINALARVGIFSLFLNAALALTTISISAPHGMFLAYLVKPTLFKVVALLVLVNIPLDIAAYLCTRLTVRVAMRNSIAIIGLLTFGAIFASYIISMLSTAIGASLTMFGIMEIDTGFPVAQSLFFHWFSLALFAPFTSQVALNGINVGYLAIGALPSAAILCTTLLFMIILQTLIRLLHYELCFNLGRILDDKKSFFELMALICSAVLCFLWSVVWTVSYFMK